MIIEQIINFNTLNLINIHQIEWWLLEYKYYYHSLIQKNANTQNKSMIQIIESLPESIKPKYEDKFLNIYEEFEQLSSYYKFEGYFKEQNNEYYKSLYSKKKIRQWISYNEDIGANTFASFLLDYLDYNSNPIHLNIALHTLPKVEVFVDRTEFRSILDFLEAFNNLYWSDDFKK